MRLYNESMSRHIYDRDTKTQTPTVVLDLSYQAPVTPPFLISGFAEYAFEKSA